MKGVKEKKLKNTQDLSECKFPKKDCLIIGQDEGGYYTDTGYITDSEATKHFQKEG